MAEQWIAEESRLQETLARVAGAGRTGGMPAPLPREPSWSFGDVVGWWLRAAEAIDGLDERARDEVCRSLGCGDGRQHPVVWCHERRTRLRFGVADFAKQLDAKGQTWRGAATSQVETLARLFRWVTSCERPGMPAPGPRMQAWIDDLHEVFAEIEDDHARLFGAAHATTNAGPLCWATRHEWIPRWVTSSVGDRFVHEVRRPIVSTKHGQRRALFKGLAVVTLPVAVVARLKAPTPAPAGCWHQGVSRAVDAAADRWRDVTLLSKAIQDAAGNPADGLEPEAIDRIFLPAARCLVAAADGMVHGARADDTAWRSLCEHLALGLALDGFELRPVDPPTPDGGRVIPSRNAPLDTGPRSFAFVHAASGTDVPIGEFAGPAACDEELLAAIEAVDWRLWAYQHAPWKADDTRLAEVRRIILHPKTWPAWEPLKRRVLHGTAEAATFRDLFEYVHKRRLATRFLREKTYGEHPADAMLSGLEAEYAALEREAWSRLVALDPAAPAALVPPRRCDAGIDLPAWLETLAAGGPAESWRFDWIRDAQPVATVLDERRDGNSYVVTVSAGSVSEADLAILRLPPPGPRDAARPGSLADTLGTFQSAVVRVLASSGAAADPLGQALPRLRDVLAGSRAPAFDELVARWRTGDEPESAWFQALAADGRFVMTCHPPVDPASKAVAAAGPEDSFLDWEFDERVPAGGDVSITFALEPARARRVISRGPRVRGSPADLAAETVAAAGAAERLADRAFAARRAADRWTCFPETAPHPVSAMAAVLDALLDADVAPPAVRGAVFEAVQRWCSALGHEVVPAAWSPTEAVSPEAVVGEPLVTEFHPDVAAGSVIVRGFGLRGARPVSFSGAISAGPAPPGFGALQDAVRDVSAAAGSAWATVAQRVDDLAKHALADTQQLAASNLFDAFWEAAAAAAADVAQGRVEDAKTGLLELLKAVGGLVPFEPSSVGDYPTAWLRESDGKQVRGRRIRRLVRPGLRTLDNKLVRPALVITE